MSRVIYKGFRNGFPFVVPTWNPEAISDPTERELLERKHPVAVPIGLATRWHWRVRQWQVAWNLLADGNDSYIDSVILITSNFGGSLVRETELLFNNTASSIAESVGPFDTGEFSMMREQDGFPFTPVDALCFRDGALYRPRINISFGGYINLDTTFLITTNEDEFQGPQTESVAVTVDGVDVPVNTFSNGWEVTGTMSFTPHKFWTYGGLYDEDTGDPV